MSEENKKPSSNLEAWMPVLSKLVYPILICFGLLFFKDELSTFYNQKILEGNSDVSLSLPGGFGLEINQKAKETAIDEMGFSSLSDAEISTEFRPSNQQDAYNFVVKATSHELRDRLRNNPGKKAYESLLLPSGKRYSVRLLESYINMLGVKYVVFVRDGKYEGLIHSKLFINQFANRAAVKSYDEIKREVVGVENSSVVNTSSTLEALNLMNSKDIEEVAVVDVKGTLQYIVKREEIISKLVAQIITEETEK